MRLFVGIGLPESIAQALAGAACRSVSLAPGSASRIRWTPPGSLHVTLSFLGQVEPARLEPIAAALAGVTASPLLLALDGLGLSLLVERHDDDARAVAAHDARLLEEVLLPLLQAQ